MCLVLLQEVWEQKLHTYRPYCFFLLFYCTLPHISDSLNGGNRLELALTCSTLCGLFMYILQRLSMDHPEHRAFAGCAQVLGRAGYPREICSTPHIGRSALLEVLSTTNSATPQW